MRIRMNASREENLRRLMQATGESTKSKAIDVAVNHYLADLRNKREIADQLSREQVDTLHTPWLPIHRDETLVGIEVAEQ